MSAADQNGSDGGATPREQTIEMAPIDPISFAGPRRIDQVSGADAPLFTRHGDG